MNNSKIERDRKEMITANDYCYDDYELYKTQRRTFLEAKKNEKFIKDSQDAFNKEMNMMKENK